jgi:isocitrate/isopropylmalate dehydrogenase
MPTSCPTSRAALAGSLRHRADRQPESRARVPSMFEPIHGSAFDIMGKGVANPVGTFWSAVMMLEHLGEKPPRERLMRAIERVTADKRFHTPGSWRHGAHRRRDGRGDRCDPWGECVSPQSPKSDNV